MPDSQELDLQHDFQHAGHQPSLTQSYPSEDSEEVERPFAGTVSPPKKSALALALEKDARDAPHRPAHRKPAFLQGDGTDGGARRCSEGGRVDALQCAPLSAKPSPTCTRPAPRTPSSVTRRRVGSATPGQAARRRGAATVGVGRPTNPFIEYEDREVKLQQERKWLEQDSVFMRIRREGMRHQGVTVRNVTRNASESALYENRTMYGNYSVQLRRNKAIKDGFVGNATGSPSRTPLVASAQRTGKSKMGDHPHLKLLKTLQLTMEESTRNTEECMKQASIGDDVLERRN
jgi:hypothetical protein